VSYTIEQWGLREILDFEAEPYVEGKLKVVALRERNGNYAFSAISNWRECDGRKALLRWVAKWRGAGFILCTAEGL